MKKILISGLVNTETVTKVRKFPIDYYPIDYPFFGISTAVSGVAYNIALAMKTLGDEVQLLSMTGNDFPAAYIRKELENTGISPNCLKQNLRETPSSVVLYEESGRRQIYCDLKDIQETSYGFSPEQVADADVVVACNINFNRELLHLAKAMGKTVATDVHVLGNIHDDYNREFMEAADILFLSDESVWEDYRAFLWELSRTYNPRIIVLGRGSKGAAMFVRDHDRIYDLEAVRVGEVINTVGAGDALFSAFVHFYTQGMEPLECLKRAQIFASAKIRVSGASRGFVTEAEIEEMSQWN